MEKNPINFDASEKRLSFVYNSDVSGFQPLDFGKLNNLEDVLINFSGFGVNVHQDDLNPITDSVSVSGRLYEVISGFDTFGINVHQDDLNSITDSVSVSGRLYEVISGFDTFGVNVHQDDLTASTDFVTAVPEKGSSISNYTPSGGASATILGGNATRKQLYVQNLSTGTLNVKYGASAAINSYNFVLGGASYLSGGNGGVVSDFGYTGVVSVCSGAGTGPINYIAWERT